MVGRSQSCLPRHCLYVPDRSQEVWTSPHQPRVPILRYFVQVFVNCFFGAKYRTDKSSHFYKLFKWCTNALIADSGLGNLECSQNMFNAKSLLSVACGCRWLLDDIFVFSFIVFFFINQDVYCLASVKVGRTVTWIATSSSFGLCYIVVTSAIMPYLNVFLFTVCTTII